MLRQFNRITNTATVTPRKADAPHFIEVQKFRQTWLWVLMTVVVLAQLGLLTCNVAAALTISVPSVLFAGAIFGFFLYARLITEVDEDGIVIRFRGLFTNRRIRFDEIAEFGARTYRPLVEYGGWGIRGFSSNRAYNVSGDRGVQLLLTNGSRVLIGSQRADDLARAIAEASSRETSTF